VNGHVLLFGDEVQDVAAVLAFAKTVPEVFFGINPELRGIGAAVNRARPAQAVAGAFERVEDTVVFQHVFHGDSGTDFPKIYERFFRHSNTPFNVLFWGGTKSGNPASDRTLARSEKTNQRGTTAGNRMTIMSKYRLFLDILVLPDFSTLGFVPLPGYAC